MKKAFLSFVCVLLLFALRSVAAIATEQFTSSTNLRDDETRPVEPFTGVASSVAFDVFIKIGPKASLRLEGDRELLDRIETPVKNGVLHLKMKKERDDWGWKSKKVTVYITAPNLNRLTVSGSGNMTVDGTVKAEKMATEVSGSGRLSATVAATSLTSAISGSGEIEVRGQTKEVKIEISGSGKFDGEKLNSQAAAISVSGSGKASIRAEDSLNATLSGSGKVYYSGNAKVNVMKSGSGSVTKI